MGEAAQLERRAGNLAPVQSYPSAPGYEPGYAPAPPTVRAMTIDDVVVRTVGLLGLTGLSGALAWAFVPDESAFGFAMGAAVVGLILGLVIAFARVTNPLVICSYAIVEGVFLGLISKFFEARFEGIVVQAAVGTFGVFFLMAMLYKARVIRATPKFVKGVIAATLGAVAIMAVNLIMSLFGVNLHLRDGGPIAILVSLVFIVIAALNFVLDFHMVEEGVRYGLPQKYAWACAFGILVTLIWMYIEILRLLSYLRGD